MHRLVQSRWRPAGTASALLVALAASARAQGPDGPAPQAEPWPRASPLGDEDGFRLRSRDGSSELSLEGWLVAEGSWNGSERRPQSEYDLYRMRLDLTGSFERAFHVRLQPDFAQEDFELEEAWVGVDLFGGAARFSAGRNRVPFGLEEMRPQRFVDLPRFSVLHQFTPRLDTGLFVGGESERGRFEWNLAVVNGTGGDDVDGDKDLAARLAFHPFRNARRGAPAEQGGVLENLHVGGALTVGRQEVELDGESIDNAAGLPLMIYAPGARLDGTRLRLGLEGGWHRGPWFVQAELMRIREDLAIDEDELGADFDGGYVNLSYVLTGEEKTYEGVVPREPFDPFGGGGAGAWVASLRYSELHTDGELAATGILVPETWVGRVRSVELGVDWILTRHALVRLAWIHSDYSNDALVGDELVGGEDAAILQLQIAF